MNCIVTAGPTYEPLDEVRRMTNFSSGRLGSELTTYLNDFGHRVTLLVGQQAIWHGERRAAVVQTFTTTSSLSDQLRLLGGPDIDAVFHAAAVSDFAFGKTWQRSPTGELTQLKEAKISTRAGNLLVELVPTAKIIFELRKWFPKACLVGWKYEMDGDRDAVLLRAARQIAESKTDFCVANGAAYGSGFGIVDARGELEHCETMHELFPALELRMRKR